MRSNETWGERMQRSRSGKTLPPLRSFKELCDELGVREKVMAGLLSRSDAPKPAVFHVSRVAGRNSYFEPVAFKAWFASINKEPK